MYGCMDVWGCMDGFMEIWMDGCMYVWIIIYILQKCATEADLFFFFWGGGRWRRAKFNIGSSFQDDFILYVGPYMLVIRYCDGLWHERKNNYVFHNLEKVLAAQGFKGAVKKNATSIKILWNWSSRARRGQEPPSPGTLSRIWSHFGIHFWYKIHTKG